MCFGRSGANKHFSFPLFRSLLPVHGLARGDFQDLSRTFVVIILCCPFSSSTSPALPPAVLPNKQPTTAPITTTTSRRLDRSWTDHQVYTHSFGRGESWTVAHRRGSEIFTVQSETSRAAANQRRQSRRRTHWRTLLPQRAFCTFVLPATAKHQPLSFLAHSTIALSWNHTPPPPPPQQCGISLSFRRLRNGRTCSLSPSFDLLLLVSGIPIVDSTNARSISARHSRSTRTHTADRSLVNNTTLYHTATDP